MDAKYFFKCRGDTVHEKMFEVLRSFGAIDCMFLEHRQLRNKAQKTNWTQLTLPVLYHCTKYIVDSQEFRIHSREYRAGSKVYRVNSTIYTQMFQ